LLETNTHLPSVLWIALPIKWILRIRVAYEACRFFTEARQSGAMELLLVSPLTNQDLKRGQWKAFRILFFWPLTIYVGSQLIFSVILFCRAGAPLLTTPLLLLYLDPLFFLADIMATFLAGMAIALTTKKPRQAFMLTVVWTFIVPFFIPCFYRVFCRAIADVVLALWASDKLRADFRDYATLGRD
jgi:hypothetical protein